MIPPLTDSETRIRLFGMAPSDPPSPIQPLLSQLQLRAGPWSLVCSYLRTFTPAVPSACYILPGMLQAHSFTAFKLLLKCHLQIELQFLN